MTSLHKILILIAFYLKKVVFFLLIAKIIPPTSIAVPLISKYLLFTFIMNIISVLNTCIVIGFYYKRLNLDQMQPWLRFILFRLIPMLLFLNRKKVKKTHTADTIAKTTLPIAAYSASRMYANTTLPTSTHRQKRAKLMKMPSSLSLNYAATQQSPIKYAKHMDLSSGGGENFQNSPLLYHASMRNIGSEKKLEECEKVRKCDSINDLLLLSDLNKRTTLTSHRKVILKANDLKIEENTNFVAVESSTTTKFNKLNTNTRLVSKSSLYKMEKFVHQSPTKLKTTKAPDLVNITENGFEWDKKKPSSGFEKKFKATNTKNIVSIDNIKLTDRFLNVCRSVDYIANIMKAKAELDEVSVYFKYKLITLRVEGGLSLSIF